MLQNAAQNLPSVSFKCLLFLHDGVPQLHSDTLTRRLSDNIGPRANAARSNVRFVPIADISQISPPIKTERPPRGGLSENSNTLTSTSSAALLMLHQDLGAELHARVKIGDIVIDQPEAT